MSEVHLGHDDPLVRREHLTEIAGERVEVTQMGLGDFDPGASNDLAGSSDGAVRGTPAEHENASIAAGVIHLDIDDGVRDCVDLRLAQAHHAIMVLRVVGDVARAVRLLEAPDAMLETSRSRNSPGARQSLRITLVSPELLAPVLGLVVRLCREIRIDDR